MFGVIIIAGILVAVFVTPDAWDVPVVIGAVLVEIAETTFWWRISRRGHPKVGMETMVGLPGVVTEACRPIGRVKVRGEPWRASSQNGADPGDRVTVRGWVGLTLLVEPDDEGSAHRHTEHQTVGR
jgi:membrane protein implicated in regulation of membrane protease activity